MSSPRKVLFLSFHLPLPDEPGAFRPWVEARLLQRLGFEVTAITSARHYLTGDDTRKSRSWCDRQEYDGIRILRVWGPGARSRRIRSRVAQYVGYGLGALIAGLIYGGQAEFVFAGTDPVSAGPAAFMLARLKRAHLVLDERDLYPETAVALGVLKEGLFSRLVFRLQEFWRRRSRAILAATPGIARSLESYGHPHEKIHLFMNADPYLSSERTPTNVQTQDLHDTLGRSLVVAYSGGLGLANDVGTLLSAAELLRDDTGIGVAIIGEGERRTVYEKRCFESGLDGIRFLGPQPRNIARALLGSADVCVHLYFPGELFRGALASKVFDYLALGKPIVFAGSGDTAELLEQAGAAIVVPASDPAAVAGAIRKLRGDPELRLRLGASGLAWYRKHVGVEAALAVFAKVFDPTSPPAEGVATP